MRIYDVKTKLVKTILTVISIGVLFANWIVTYGDFEYDWMEYRSEIISSMNAVKNFASLLGEEIDVEGVEKIVDCVLDGKLSAVEMTTIAIEGDALLYMDENAIDEDIMITLKICCWGYIGVFYGVFIIAVVMLYNIWKNSKAICEYGFLSMQIVLCVIACLLCFSTREITSQLELDQMFVIRPTLWLVLAVVSAIPTNWLEKLPIYNSDFIKSEILKKTISKGKNVATTYGVKLQNVVIEKWECKACGKKNNVDARFCSNCGKKKPENVKCKNCGSEIQDDDAFCKKCGTRLEKEKTICANCGCSIEGDNEFCEYCGTRINR